MSNSAFTNVKVTLHDCDHNCLKRLLAHLRDAGEISLEIPGGSDFFARNLRIIKPLDTRLIIL